MHTSKTHLIGPALDVFRMKSQGKNEWAEIRCLVCIYFGSVLFNALGILDESGNKSQEHLIYICSVMHVVANHFFFSIGAVLRRKIELRVEWNPNGNHTKSMAFSTTTPLLILIAFPSLSLCFSSTTNLELFFVRFVGYESRRVWHNKLKRFV